MLKKLQKNGKKGFTLVELIVVLVILAILAALLVPALTGYIDKAKEKQIIAETRQVVMAAQTLADEAYGVFTLGAEKDITVGTDATDLPEGKISKTDIATLAEVKEGYITSVIVGKTGEDSMKGKVYQVVYNNGVKTCTYTKENATTAGTYVITNS